MDGSQQVVHLPPELPRAKQKSLKWLILAGALSGLISVGAVVYAVMLIVNHVSQSQILVCPGEATLRLERGSYGVWYEYPGMVEGRSLGRSEQIPAMSSSLTNVVTGNKVPVSPARFGATMSTAAMTRILVWDCPIEQGGNYKFSINSTEKQQFVLVIAKSFPWAGFFGSLMGGIVCFFGSIVLFIIVLAKWLHRRREQRAVN